MTAHRLTRWLIRCAIALLLLLTIACGSLFLVVLHKRHQAQALLHALDQIRLGQTTEAQTLAILKHFGDTCYDTSSLHDDYITLHCNQYLWPSHTLAEHGYERRILLPYIWVRASIDYDHGVAVGKYFSFYQTSPANADGRIIGSLMGEVSLSSITSNDLKYILQVERVDKPGRHLRGYAPPYLQDKRMSYIHRYISVIDDESVPLARRQQDWRLDLSCLSTPYGCPDPAKVMASALKN